MNHEIYLIPVHFGCRYEKNIGGSRYKILLIFRTLSQLNILWGAYDANLASISSRIFCISSGEKVLASLLAVVIIEIGMNKTIQYGLHDII